MTDIVINLQDISKYYKLYKEPKDRLKEALNPFRNSYHQKYFALKSIDLKVHKGDVLGVVGRNGCGKSTLLKLISGVLQPSSGKLSVKGKITALLELGAGFNPEFTGIDNIHFYANIIGLDAQEINEKLPSIIEFAGLGDFLYQPVKTYSSGMKSRLGFSVAVHVDPEILILDEVLAVGDALFKRKCYAKMEEFFNAGKTIIYVSHDANSINQLCNRAILLHDGGILIDDEPNIVTKYYEKLLFAKTSNLKHVVKEAQENSSKNLASQQKSPQREMLTPYFIQDLAPSSTMIYRDYEVEIINPVIKTLDGKVVNVLVSGEKYIYSHQVTFDQAYQKVAFGMKLKNEQGVQLTGATSLYEQRFVDVKTPGELYNIEWQFTCNLVEGMYYLNTGITSSAGADLIMLSRTIDILLFKVKQNSALMDKGTVYLQLELGIQKELPSTGASHD